MSVLEFFRTSQPPLKLSNKMSKTPLPPELTDLLARLRARIQRYVLLEGTASVVVVLGILFWLSLGLDWSYFRLQRAELPRWIRFVVEVAGICTCLALFVGWVAVRFWRHFRQRALAMVLERRFPELNDRLITAIELGSEQAGVRPQLTEAMLQRTIEEVREASTHLDLTSVFDKRPLLRAGISASCLLVSVLAFAICFTDVFGLWFRRNVLLANEGWQRETAMQLVVLAEPGERVVEFKDRVYKHPRGSDLTLQGTVLPNKKVPEQVQLRYSMTDGSTRGRAYLSKLGETQFKHTLTGLLNSLDCYLIAGDAERTLYHIEVVEPPRIDQIVLDSMYPAYTGWNEVPEGGGPPRRTPKPVQGTQLSLPAGTDFLLRADANKPLVGVRIQTAAYDLEFSREVARLTLFQQDGQTRGGTFVIKTSEAWLDAGGKTFSVPFLMAGPKDQSAISETGEVLLPLRLPPDAQIKIFLSDIDDIRSAEPARLTINSIADEPPRIDTQLRGIGSVITRKAVIPVTGSISDDYGVADARFDYRLDSADAQPRTFPVQPKGVKKFSLAQSTNQPWLRFDVQPLELKIGQKLSLMVIAADADNLHGPHFAQGEKYNFSIVSDEELLSQLYARELNLRQRFEQILTEVVRTQTDLTVARKSVVDLSDQRRKPPATKGDQKSAQQQAQQIEVLDQTTTTAAERGLYGIRKNHNETLAIGQSLSDIREEMVNNGVDTPDSLERMDAKLIRPLNGINQLDFPDVDQRLGLFRLALQEQTDPLNRLDESLSALDRLKRKLQQVLVEMRTLETYKELVEILKDIKIREVDLKKRTETENKRSIINKLK